MNTMTRFKKEFLEKLTLPNNLKDIEIPENVTGGVRLKKNKIVAVYLKDVKSIEKFKDKHIILKFKHIESNFIFDRIYLCEDGFNEIGYDKDLNVVSRDLVLYNYVKGFGIPLYEDKIHTESILKEWEETNKHLAVEDYEEGFISAYKIERDGHKIKIPYLVCDDKITLSHIKDLDKILYDFKSKIRYRYGCKCKIIKKEIIKDNNNIYIVA